jgi:predicted RNA-binding Zn-ribbon protein involved in translation (DUF1610 family)
MHRTFGHEVPVCPKCGKAYISRELPRARWRRWRFLLEDK